MRWFKFDTTLRLVYLYTMNNAPHDATPQGPLTRLEEREALATAVLVWGRPGLAPHVAELIRKRWVDHPWAHRKTLHLEDSSDLTGL